MSVTSMSIDEVREQGQDFSIPYHLGYSLVMYKKPDRTSTRSMYIMPFKYSVSFCCMNALDRYKLHLRYRPQTKFGAR